MYINFDLDEKQVQFVTGYLTAVLFADLPEELEGETDNIDFAAKQDIDDLMLYFTHDALQRAFADCLSFFYRVHFYIDSGLMERAGADFHFTREGNGVGFWDEGRWPTYFNILDKTAVSYGAFEWTAEYFSAWEEEE